MEDPGIRRPVPIPCDSALDTALATVEARPRKQFPPFVFFLFLLSLRLGLMYPRLASNLIYNL